jgi:hypothetical protein
MEAKRLADEAAQAIARDPAAGGTHRHREA